MVVLCSGRVLELDLVVHVPYMDDGVWIYDAMSMLDAWTLSKRVESTEYTAHQHLAADVALRTFLNTQIQLYTRLEIPQ